VSRVPGAIGPHFAPKAKHVIYLHMVGGPPQQDMFDYKPQMNEWYDKDLPESVRKGQRLTTMTSGQKPGSRSRPRSMPSSSMAPVRHVGLRALALDGQHGR
jgi:hypothetical protein